MTSKEIRQRAVVEAYKVTCNVAKACECANVARRQHYDWMATDPSYKQRFEAAKEEAIQILEDEAVRRAHEGVLKPVTHQGSFTYEPVRNEDGSFKTDDKGNIVFSKQPLSIREYSDSLLMFLLKGRRRDVFGDKVKIEHTGDIVHRLAAARQRMKKPAA